MRRRGVLLLLGLGLLASSVYATGSGVLFPVSDPTPAEESTTPVYSEETLGPREYRRRSDHSPEEESTTPVYREVNPVPTWVDILGQKVYNQSSVSSVSQFHSKRVSWPNKPHLDLKGEDVRAGHATPSTVPEVSRTTGGGLLLHLSLPPPPPPGSARGPPPHVLVDQLRTQLQRNNPGWNVDWVRPTGELCPAEQDSRFRAPNGEPLHWPATKIGDSALPLEACLDSDMEPVRRPCLQDLTFGAQWADPEGTCDAGESSEATQGLLNVTSLTVSVGSAALVTRQLAEAMGRALTPRAGDVLLLAAALARVSAVAQGLSASCLPDLTNLLDGVLRASEAHSQQDNMDKDAEATSSILTSLDAILARMQLDDASDGLASSFTPRAALLVADVARSGVEGVMATSTGSGAAFSDVWPLRGDQSGTSEGAELVARITGDVTGSRAAFVLIGNSRPFPKRQNKVRLNSRVVGVTVSGNKGAGIEVQLRPLTSVLEPGLERLCAFWDLATSTWSTAGCSLVRVDAASGRDVCRCTHLTHFGEIIGVRGESRVLDVLSLAGCVLSLLGLTGIALTAAVFRQWRSRLGNKILLHLSGAIGLTMIAFLGIALGGASGGSGDPGCIVLGALLHYSVLASFCWMLVSAALQLLRFVVVLSSRPPHFLLKGVLVGWGTPLVPVLALVIAGPAHSYSALDRGDGSQPFCYPRGIALILAVIVPVAMAVIANLTVFCIIVYRVTCGRNRRLHGNVSAMSERRMAIRQLRMSILLFFLLGLSWVFGLLALIAPNIDAWRLILSYLFCATATLQGLALFLFFVVWERKTRALWLATLPETVRIRSMTSDTTSGLSPSTGTSSAPTRSRDEAAPLRHRNAELDVRTSGGVTANGYQTTQPQTRL